MSPFFRPEAFAWACRIVPSTDTTDRSNSSDNTQTLRSKSPFCTHWTEERTKAPDDTVPVTTIRGKIPLSSAHDGDPVRKRYGTASRKRRLSAVRPGSVAFPDRSGSIRSHIASVKTVRSFFMIRLSQYCPSPLFSGNSESNHTNCPRNFKSRCQRALIASLRSKPTARADGQQCAIVRWYQAGRAR